MHVNRMQRDDSGSMIIFMSVAMIATALVLVLVDVTHQGLRSSRRFGDSANALQATDAGVNDAVTEVAKQSAGQSLGSTFTRSGGVGEGTYTYSATLDEYPVSSTKTAPVWHIDARGRDARGTERRVRSDAVAESLFSQAIFSKGAGVFGTGLAVDSYLDGTSAANTCTGQGFVGTNDPEHLAFGNGNGGPQGGAHENCQWLSPGGTWPVDACIAYYAPEDLAAGGYPPLSGMAGHCPTIQAQPGTTPGTWKEAPLFKPPTVGTPSGTPSGPLTCGSGGGQTQLQAGQVYFVTSLNLRNGCTVQGGDPTLFNTITPSAPDPGAAKVFVAGNVSVGGGGSNDMINPPPANQAAGGPCGATGQQSSATTMGTGQDAMSLSYFCPGWPRTLQIYVVGNGEVRFENNGMKVWAVLAVPNGTAYFASPQMHVFGAMVTGSASGSGNGSPQWNWHYDESLSSILTGRYFLDNWRECPITSTANC